MEEIVENAMKNATAQSFVAANVTEYNNKHYCFSKD